MARALRILTLIAGLSVSLSAVTVTLPGSDQSVKFAAIGDTGTGDRRQYDVAADLAEAHASFPFEFVIMMGDNIYGSDSPSSMVQYRPTSVAA